MQIPPGEPENIFALVAFEVCHVPHSVCANDDASENMSSIFVTLSTSHFERSMLNDDAEANMPPILYTLDTSHLEMSPLNDDAEQNMWFMLVTPDTSHLEMSPLKLFASGTTFPFALNNLLMSVTAETSHDPIGPCGPFEQSVDS